MKYPFRQSILVSYLIGAPIGIFAVVATFWVPALFSGEGLPSMLMGAVYGIPAIGLLAAFLIALWWGGKLSAKDVQQEKPLLLVSFRYSLLINSIIWTVFCLILGITSGREGFLLMLPAGIAFPACTGITTLTIGLVIAYCIRGIHRRHRVRNLNMVSE